MKVFALVLLSLAGLGAFADGLPKTLVCYELAAQTVCDRPDLCLFPSGPGNQIGQVRMRANQTGASASLAMPVNVFGLPMTLAAQGQYSVNGDGSGYSPNFQVEITDMRSGWTMANYSQDSRSEAYLSMSHVDRTVNGQYVVSRADFICDME